MSTPHNEALQGAFAKTVLMPGDPLRARFIAETFLQDAELVNNVRGIQGYTGRYQGVPVSVMASGMGMPSIGIYSHELFHVYDVDNIIRVGSAGAISPRLKLRDVVMAQGACTDSNYAHQYGLPGTFAPIADFTLLETAVAVARRMGIEPPVGNLLSSDVFYNKAGNTLDWGAMGVLAIEMETAALYCNAAEAGKRALTICTVSDSLVTGEELPPAERQTSFTQMMEIALGVAVELAKK
jgi:purine-nucleoside phosphorylase